MVSGGAYFQSTDTGGNTAVDEVETVPNMERREKNKGGGFIDLN